MMNGQSKSAERVIDILEAVASASGSLGVSGLARRLRIPKSSTWHLVRTLLRRRYLEETPAGEFVLGARLFDVGVCARADTRMQTVARPIMAELVERTGETIFLGILTPDFEMLQLDKVVSPQVIRYDAELGEKRPAHCTAIGKLLLADLTEEQLDYYFRTKELQRFTRRTITTRTGLLRELDRIRRTGVSVNVDERVPGASAIGAAVRTAGGRAIAGIIIAGPTNRILARQDDLAHRVSAAATRISKALDQNNAVGPGVSDKPENHATSGPAVVLHRPNWTESRDGRERREYRTPGPKGPAEPPTRRGQSQLQSPTNAGGVPTGRHPSRRW